MREGGCRIRRQGVEEAGRVGMREGESGRGRTQLQAL